MESCEEVILTLVCLVVKLLLIPYVYLWVDRCRIKLLSRHSQSLLCECFMEAGILETVVCHLLVSLRCGKREVRLIVDEHLSVVIVLLDSLEALAGRW